MLTMEFQIEEEEWRLGLGFGLEEWRSRGGCCLSQRSIEVRSEKDVQGLGQDRQIGPLVMIGGTLGRVDYGVSDRRKGVEVRTRHWPRGGIDS